MANVKAFSCIRPKVGLADQIAALPYDVYNRKEAVEAIKDRPLSFLRIDRAETQFDSETDTYDDKVYQKAHDLLWEMVEDGSYIKDEEPCYYIYELIMDGRSQTGITACVSIDDYLNNVVKKHENTRADKEVDRIKHVDTCEAQTGPIFLAYHADQKINDIVAEKKKDNPLYDFVSEDGICHKVWKISKKDHIEVICQQFAGTNLYIADGHHRAASAVKVGVKRREENPEYNGTEEFNYFLAVLFPDEQLKIMDYNRVVKDLNGNTPEEFLSKIDEIFQIDKIGKDAYRPEEKGQLGMFLENEWYKLTVKPQYKSSHPVDGLDVAILQEQVLTSILGIKDIKTDKRIDFVGGIRGLKELEKRVHDDCKVAFAMYPTSIQELIAVSDAGLLMPPKSTWFEPKLRSGIFIHSLKE